MADEALEGMTVDYGLLIESDNGWYWRAVSFNGRNVAIGGEPFTEKSNAARAFRAMWPQVPLFDDDSIELHAFLADNRQGGE